eukprot:1160989-Pelagomonas_calceolata.AAC.13
MIVTFLHCTQCGCKLSVEHAASTHRDGELPAQPQDQGGGGADCGGGPATYSEELQSFRAAKSRDQGKEGANAGRGP